VVEYQLRTYRVKPGEMDDWVAEWRQHVVPLRRAKGFEVFGGWRGERDDTFVWIVGYEGSFAEADAAYYASPERAAISPDPARHLGNVETRMLRRVL